MLEVVDWIMAPMSGVRSIRIILGKDKRPSGHSELEMAQEATVFWDIGMATHSSAGSTKFQF